MELSEGRYVGQLYRAVNPVYARTPLSGRGAELYGGRFNAKKTPALYTTLDPVGALREANQVGSLQPTILIAYSADLKPIFDTRDVRQLNRRGMSDAVLGDPGWRAKMLNGEDVPTQKFADDLIVDGFVGLLVRSYAKGSTETDLNIVLWRWSGSGCRLNIVDDEDRLSRM